VKPELDSLDLDLLRACKRARKAGLTDAQIINTMVARIREHVLGVGGSYAHLAAMFDALSAQCRGERSIPERPN